MVVITESSLRVLDKKGIPNPYYITHDQKITPAAVDFLRERKIQIISKQRNNEWERPSEKTEDLLIPVGVSNRHVHLSVNDIELLFGSNYTLTPYRKLSQYGQFAAEEQVALLGSKGIIRNVRILGPARDDTQVEISITDGYQLGIHPPVRLSGLIEKSPGITLIGPTGCVSLIEGVIVAKRHVHMSSQDAIKFGVKHGDILLLETLGERSMIFSNVTVRVSENYQLDFHIDLDEGNAAGLKTGDQVRVIGKNGEFF